MNKWGLTKGFSKDFGTQVRFTAPTAEEVQKDQKSRKMNILCLVFFVLFLAAVAGLVATTSVMGAYLAEISSLNTDVTSLKDELKAADELLASTISDYESQI